MKYIIKIFRHRPNRSYFLTCDLRVCTYKKEHAFRFDNYDDALAKITRILEFGVAKDEKPMMVEVRE